MATDTDTDTETETKMEPEPEHKKQGTYKRTILFINKEFQFKFILYMLIPNISCLLFFNILINLYLLKLMKKGEEIGYAPDSQYFLTISDQISFMNTVFIGLVIIISLFSIMYGLLLSHKIAGPLFNLKRHLLHSAETLELKELRFRPDDFFLDIPPAYNKFIEALEEKNN